MRYQAEVRDVGKCGVGTAVYVARSEEEARTWISVTLQQQWAGPWSLFGPGIEIRQAMEAP